MSAPLPSAPPAVRASELFRAVLAAERPAFVAAALASLLANLVALATSLYSMQIYDRVIPTQGLSTLTVLTVGALGACVFELVIKLARSRILEASVRQMDGRLSHAIFARLLSIRIDQLPSGVGSVSAQVRSYESIRAFASTATMYAAVDAPFGLLFLAVMGLLAGAELVAVPAAFFVVALVVGTLFRRRIARHAGSASAAGNRKAGLLVETLDNAEGIKAGGTGPARLAQWDALSAQALDDELAIKHCSDSASYFSGFVQQTSYIVMIAVGAYIAATSTTLTTGGLIACSILSGRVLAPIGMLPGLIVQWAHARIALANLECIFALEQDHHGIAQPLQPARIAGAVRIENLTFAYPGRPPMQVARLELRAGERVAILGPIGAGKSTLLKLVAGLYKPTAGRVLIDDLELQQIARPALARHIGYLQQDPRLSAGTLRDNLGGGAGAHDDAALLDACRSTGLAALVAGHPKGLDLEIGEGGSGVSGGQRRLIGLTRLLLAAPSMWLLDEPTAAMDDATERAVLALLRRTIRPDQTLVLVTHKPELLQLVERIVVLTETGIALDGPRALVLQALAQRGPQPLRPVDGPAVAGPVAPAMRAAA
ncbi:MAG: ATP-binding cassette domain-containing protein [Burkholderiaceae bacterium]